MAVMQEMLRTVCGVLLAAFAALLLASGSREHIHGAQRGHPRHRLPDLSGKSLIKGLLQGDAGCS